MADVGGGQELTDSSSRADAGGGKAVGGLTAGSSNPSPAIVKKVKKVVEIRLEAPELTVALQQLNEFYGSNTLENRRNLRSSIQKRSVQVTNNFVDCFQDVMDKIDSLQSHVTQLSECTERMQQRIKAAHTTTSQVVKVTEQLQRKEEAATAHRELVELLLARFRLSPREEQVLKEEPMSEEVLVLLGRLATMQKESKELLRVHHKTALMDMVDSSAALQEVAFDRLYRWLQEQLSVMESDSGEVPTLVSKGIRTLQGRPALFKLCLEELSSRRKQQLHKRFLAALTRGGPGGTPKPIEMHAHDPLRFVGDMLAWAHQALASERDLVSSLLASAPPDTPASPTATDAAAQHDMVVSEVLGGLSGTVEARLQGVLSGQSSAVVLFKVGNLILFYLHTIGGLLPEGSPLTTTLQSAHKLSGKRFMAALNVTASKLVKHPPPCPPSLAPHPEVTSLLDELAEIMSSFDSSLIPARMRQAYLKPVVDEAVEPLIGGCALAANSVSAAEGPVYLVNCLLAIQGVLQRFEFCHWRLPQLQAQLTAALEQAVREQVVSVMRQCNLDEKMYTLRAFRAEGGNDGSEKLAAQAGMDPMSISIALKQFYGKVLTSSLDLSFLEKITALSLRHQALALAAKGIAGSYKELHDAIMSPAGGYRDPQTLLLHSAQQIESLLVDAA